MNISLTNTTPSNFRQLRLILVAFCISLLAGCSTSLSDYSSTKPEFDLQTFFTGELTATGMFQNYSDKVVRRFNVEMTGHWENDKGILDETFYYADGETEKRIWTIINLGNNRYTGTADDVVGKATGRVSGFALNWQYTMRLEVDGDTYDVAFDDWMYMIDENTVINKARVTKFGFTVGEVTLVINKQS